MSSPEYRASFEIYVRSSSPGGGRKFNIAITCRAEVIAKMYYRDEFGTSCHAGNRVTSRIHARLHMHPLRSPYAYPETCITRACTHIHTSRSNRTCRENLRGLQDAPVYVYINDNFRERFLARRFVSYIMLGHFRFFFFSFHFSL